MMPFLRGVLRALFDKPLPVQRGQSGQEHPAGGDWPALMPIFFATSYYLVKGAYGYRRSPHQPGAQSVCPALAVCYFLYRKLTDRELMLSFLGCPLFLGITVPLLLAPRMDHGELGDPGARDVMAGGKLKSEFLRQLAFSFTG